MLKTSYAIGQLEAFESYGLEKVAVNARLMGTLAGSALGSMAAPEGEGLQGAVLGGGMGYLGGAGVSRGWQGAKALAGKGMEAMPGTGGKSLVGDLSTIGLTDPLSNLKRVVRPLDSKLPQFIRQDASKPSGAQPMFEEQPRYKTPPKKQKSNAAPASQGRRQSNAAPAAQRQRQEQVAKEGTDDSEGHGGKTSADLGLNARIPGTPLGLSAREREERLPGMHKWVPRDVIERAYEGLDKGLDPQAILENSADEGRFLDPAIGAGAGAAAMHFGLPKSGIAGTGLGALLGGGVGALYNQATAPRRTRDMTEALSGVVRERAADRPLQDQGTETASEPSPMLVARGGSEG
jgi:hypothetical protein